MILGKSIICEKELQSRIDNNIPLEIQLYDDFDRYTVDDLWHRLEKMEGIDIHHIHAPLRKDIKICIDDIDIGICGRDIKNTIELAGIISEKLQRKITVVIHLNDDSKHILNNPQKFKLIISLFENFINKYPRVDYAFENVTLFDEGKLFTNLYNESLSLVNELNDYFGNVRNYFGTVLDTCHAKTTVRMLEKLLQGTDLKYHNLEDYFRENKDVVKLIHLSDVKNLGLRREEHGIAFETVEDMKECVDLYKKFNYTCNIVLEIQEQDYIEAPNLMRNFQMVLDLFGGKDNVC